MNNLPTNRFKAGLKKGDTQIGLWSNLKSMIATDILGGAGFDWIVIDMEHSHNEVADVFSQLLALRGGTASAVVRPPWNDPVMIKRILDAGAQTILVPMVDSAADAQAAVRAVCYPGDGIRGVASATPASRYGRVKNYLTQAASELCVLVQVETRSGLEAIDEIVGVEGVAGIFIGPADLSAGLGYLGNPAHPKVQEAISYALDRCKAAGKPAGILTSVKEEAELYIRKGFSFVAVGTDAGLLARQTESLADHFKKG
jgi:4-hydroxy-2-oxoheptanedioate aldolase